MKKRKEKNKLARKTIREVNKNQKTSSCFQQEAACIKQVNRRMLEFSWAICMICTNRKRSPYVPKFYKSKSEAKHIIRALAQDKVGYCAHEWEYNTATIIKIN